MSLSFDVQNILVLLAGFTGIVYGLIIYSGNKKYQTNLWFFVCFVCCVLVHQYVFFRSAVEILNAVLWARILYLSAAITPVCFLGFSYIFPEDKPFLKSRKNYLIFIPFVFIAVISLLPDALIKNVNIIPGKEKEIIFNRLFLYALCLIHQYLLRVELCNSYQKIF